MSKPVVTLQLDLSAVTKVDANSLIGPSKDQPTAEIRQACGPGTTLYVVTSEGDVQTVYLEVPVDVVVQPPSSLLPW